MVALLTPPELLVTCSHAGLLLVADQPHGKILVVKLTVPEPPAAEIDWLVGLMV